MMERRKKRGSGGDGDFEMILSKYIWNERESGGCEFVNL